jgi:hypothetical protein
VTRIALTLGLVLMDGCWLAAWAVLLGKFVEPGHGSALISAVGIVALELAAAWSTERFGQRALTSGRARVVLLACGVGAVLLVLSLEGRAPAQTLVAVVTLLNGLTAPALAFILGLGVWWRGVLLGRQASTSVEVESAFRWGIAMLVLFGLAQIPAGGTEVRAATTVYVVGFFFISLITLALGRLESLTTRTRKIGINSQWLTVLIGVSAGIVMTALVLGQVISFDLLVLATRPLFDLLGRILLILAYIVVIPLAYLVELIIYALLSLLQPGVNRQRPEPLQPTDFDNFLQRLFGQGIPADVLMVLKAVVMLALLGVAIVILNRAFRRWRPMARAADVAEEERESVFVWTRLREVLLGWLRGLFQRRRPAEANVTVVENVSFGESAAATSVREVYRDLLRRGEAVGVQRAAATTPLEHAAPLQVAFEPEETVEALTAAYVEARYAERDLPQSEVDDLARALGELRPRD